MTYWRTIICGLFLGVLALEGSEGEHWAFLKPQRHNTPQVKQTDWPRNAIDIFILAELEKAKLKPSTEAGKTTLLNMAGLLERPDSGDVVVGGVRTAQLSEAKRTMLRRQ